MDKEDIAALQAATNALNREIGRVLAKYGSSIELRPVVSYNTIDGDASVWVEITTGKVVIRAEGH